MKERSRFQSLFYGIQSRFLKYVLLLLAAALAFSGLIVGIVMQHSLKKAALEKYTYTNEKISMVLLEQYEKSDALMKRCIANQEFQNSLLSRQPTTTERQSLDELLSYLDMDYLQNYLYVDNKGNVYGKPYQRIPYETFLKSGILEHLGEEYSVTKWFVEEDTLFRSEEPALFIGRYIRSMEFAHDPGVLLLKLGNGFFDGVLRESTDEEGTYLFLDEEGRLLFQKSYQTDTLSKQRIIRLGEDIKAERGQTSHGKASGIVKCGSIGSALYSWQEETGFYVVTFLPNRILNEAVFRTISIMLLVYIAAVALAVLLSVYFSKRFTSPIRQINDAMQAFDAGAEGRSEEMRLELCTNTELDTIGNSFNKMSENIRQLMTEIRQQERELYNSELNSLMYQINPHFLYNTLDTIYMLARINREETTMKMIQALSRFLKVSLSKGSGVIPLEDELEHVKSYMDIQKIRNPDLFTYEICCEKKLMDARVLKLILQPLVENSIKHGFCDIYEGGIIRIIVNLDGESLVLQVWNNGTPVEEAVIELIRQMYQCDYREMYGFFKDREGGYGVSNVMARLRLKYGTDMEYYYEIQDGGTLCTIRIPWEEEQG